MVSILAYLSVLAIRYYDRDITVYQFTRANDILKSVPADRRLSSHIVTLVVFLGVGRGRGRGVH